MKKIFYILLITSSCFAQFKSAVNASRLMGARLDTTGISDGNIFVWDNTNGKWIIGSAVSGGTAYTDSLNGTGFRLDIDDLFDANGLLSAGIKDGVVATADLASNAVDSTKILASSVLSSEIKDGAIVNADVNASAAIDGSKLASHSVTYTQLDTAAAGFVDVRKFGAVGDGVTDDTDEINAAIAYMARGGTLYIPSGKYRITNTITINDTLDILGDGWGETVLYFDGCDTAVVIGAATERNLWMNIKNVTFLGDSSTGIGVVLKNSHQISFADCNFRDFGKEGFILDNAWSNYFNNCHFLYNGQGTAASGLKIQPYSNNCAFVSCGFSQNTGYGLYSTGASYGITLSGCDAQTNTLEGLYIYGFYGVSISGGYLENNGGSITSNKRQMMIAQAHGVNVSGLYFYDGATNVDYGIYASACDNVNITNCSFTGHATASVYVTGTGYGVNYLNNNSSDPATVTYATGGTGTENITSSAVTYRGQNLAIANGSSSGLSLNSNYLNIQAPLVVGTNYTRASFGSNLIYDPTSTKWIATNNAVTDFAAMLLRNTGTIDFVNTYGLTLPDSLTDAELQTLTKMRILVSGNVGIGTTSPDAKLDVEGGGLLASDSLMIGSAGNWIRKMFYNSGDASLGIIFYNSALSRVDTVYAKQP